MGSWRICNISTKAWTLRGCVSFSSTQSVCCNICPTQICMRRPVVRKQHSGGQWRVGLCRLAEGTRSWRDCAGVFDGRGLAVSRNCLILTSRAELEPPQEAVHRSKPFKVLGFASLSKQKNESLIGFDSPLWYLRAYGRWGGICPRMSHFSFCLFYCWENSLALCLHRSF